MTTPSEVAECFGNVKGVHLGVVNSTDVDHALGIRRRAEQVVAEQALFTSRVGNSRGQGVGGLA